ncbi:nicotinate-nucleotide adenylyltransferase [Ramlibacter solisilvae]|uniref:nicotinate-nucleotide adenylyltransferase n=1 Tax=Ramlibacter tataouinensis TaxID=94132 RepID=UPI0009EF3682|nr:nicotinate-nucleotide adenylyltransferase [Ramlibacter tataouinensis]
MTQPPRLGVFGGAFDPPHKAHVVLAQAALEQLQLDELRIFPTGSAWHRAQALTAPEHRLAMAQLAFGQLPRTVIDERELRRAGPTYTVDTLRELQAERAGAQLFLVLGEDQAITLTRWREWEAIVQMATLCVAARPDARAHANLAPAGVPEQAQVRPLRLPSMPESATEVRERLAQHLPVTHLVPSGVASYIARHHLYQNQEH